MSSISESIEEAAAVASTRAAEGACLRKEDFFLIDLGEAGDDAELMLPDDSSALTTDSRDTAA